MFQNHKPFKHLKSIQMDSSAKQNIREHFVLEFKQSGASERKAEVARQLKQNPFNHFFSFTQFYKHSPMPVIGIIVALLLGTGTTFAAENTIPGDTLYPVKVNVTEEIRSVFTIGSERQAQWDIERASRRAQELVVAAQAGTLDAVMQTRAEARMQAYEEKSEALAARLEAKGNLEAAEAIRLRTLAHLELKTNLLSEVEPKNGLTEEERARRIEALKKKQAEYKAALERRHDILNAQQEEFDAARERRNEILTDKQEQLDADAQRRREIEKQQQEEFKAAIERRHEALKQQQEKYKAQLERRHNIIGNLKENLQPENTSDRAEDSQENERDDSNITEVEIEVETEVEIES